MFHPITSFVSLVECVPANTCTFYSVSKSQFCIEVVSKTMGMYLLQFAVCFSIVLYISSMCWSAYPEWGKCTLISLMRWRFTTIVVVMARSLMYLVSINIFSPLLVQHNSNAVFAVVSSCTHENVFVMCLPYICFVLSPRFTQ